MSDVTDVIVPVAEQISTPNDESQPTTPVVNEPKVGDHVGQCKWWSDKLGYGFITAQAGEMKGTDIFVHHTGIRPLNSNYKTLKKGEYVNFDISQGDNGIQAVNITGIGGGTLFCDVNPFIKSHIHPQSSLQGFVPQQVASTFVANPVFNPMQYDASAVPTRRPRVPGPRSMAPTNILAFTHQPPRPYKPRLQKQPPPPPSPRPESEA